MSRPWFEAGDHPSLALGTRVRAASPKGGQVRPNTICPGGNLDLTGCSTLLLRRYAQHTLTAQRQALLGAVLACEPSCFETYGSWSKALRDRTDL